MMTQAWFEMAESLRLHQWQTLIANYADAKAVIGLFIERLPDSNCKELHGKE